MYTLKVIYERASCDSFPFFIYAFAKAQHDREDDLMIPMRGG